jgi:hypothetical protein
MSSQADLARIKQRMNELEKLRYVTQLPIPSVRAKLLTANVPPEDVPFTLRSDEVAENKGEWQTLREGERWGQPDALYRFSFEVDLPTLAPQQKLTLRLDLSALPAVWCINTVEGLVYLNSEPFHALDRYHREIILPDRYTQSRSKLEVTRPMKSRLNVTPTRPVSLRRGRTGWKTATGEWKSTSAVKSAVCGTKRASGKC